MTLRGVQKFRCAGRTYDSVPGDVMMIPPGEVHDGKSGSSGGYAYWMFYVPETVLWDVLRDAGATGGGAVAAFPNGRQKEIRPGAVHYIPPVPHDSWVVGETRYVSLHLLGADEYAKE